MYFQNKKSKKRFTGNGRMATSSFTLNLVKGDGNLNFGKMGKSGR
jgi:hypothetical protein